MRDHIRNILRESEEIILYHGTTESRAKKIHEEGFSEIYSGEKSEYGNPHGISFTTEYDIAKEHAQWASKKFKEKGSVITIYASNLRIGNITDYNWNINNAYNAFLNGDIDAVSMCDYETGDGCEEFEVLVFNIEYINKHI